MITVDDFKNLVPNWSNEITQLKLQILIDEFQKSFMAELLGKQLAVDVYNWHNLYNEDLYNVYDLPNYYTLIFGEEWTNFKGIKQIIIYYIYWNWVKSSYYEQTAGGQIAILNENGEKCNPQIVLSSLWNDNRQRWIDFRFWLTENPIEIFAGTNEINYISWL